MTEVDKQKKIPSQQEMRSRLTSIERFQKISAICVIFLALVGGLSATAVASPTYQKEFALLTVISLAAAAGVKFVLERHNPAKMNLRARLGIRNHDVDS